MLFVDVLSYQNIITHYKQASGFVKNNVKEWRKEDDL
jgi:hypothetical protein